MKAQALTILILSTAFAASTLGNDAGSHFDRYAVPSDEPPEHASDARFYDSSHERGNVNLRSTPHRAFEIPVEETQRTVAIPSVRNCRITKSVLLMKHCVLNTYQCSANVLLIQEMPPQTHEAHRLMSECGDVNGHFTIDLTTDNFG